jgi:predicted homoserine dehydrogenase-like protein
MNLHRMLAKRGEAGRPVRIGVIGAGKFATMFLAQARHTPGMHVMAISDLDAARGRTALAAAGWPANAAEAANFAEALSSGATHITEDTEALIKADGLEVVVDATGNPAAGIRHALGAIREGRHIVMVNVEADALAGPLLARKAEAAGVVYSLAYGDQPALIAEQVDWARASGFPVVAAGKGTKYLPGYHHVTPDDVWSHYGIDADHAAAHGLNAQMFNSFLDGTKSAIEMTAVANATGLTPAPNGLCFPPVGTGELAARLCPAEEGGLLHHKGQVEVISSHAPDGTPVAEDLRWGVYTVFEAPSDYAVTSFQEYGIRTDAGGRYAAMYKPFHLIGLELGISVASAALRGEATGAPDGFRGDAVATAKRALKAGEILDGEGGYTVYGTLMPASASLAAGGLPIGLAHNVALKHDIAQDEILRWADVDIDLTAEAVTIRREMEAQFAPST